MGAIAPGMRADLVVLDPEHINLVARNGDGLLDAFSLQAASRWSST